MSLVFWASRSQTVNYKPRTIISFFLFPLSPTVHTVIPSPLSHTQHLRRPGSGSWPTRISSQRTPPPLTSNLAIPQSRPTRVQRQSSQGLAHRLSPSPLPYIFHQRAAPRKTNMVFLSQCPHLLSLCLLLFLKHQHLHHHRQYPPIHRLHLNFFAPLTPLLTSTNSSTTQNVSFSTSALMLLLQMLV